MNEQQENRSPSPSDPPTVECLAARYPDLVEMLERMRFRRDTAEDAAQEAITRGWRALVTGKALTLRNRCAWLRSVAIRKAITIDGRRGWCCSCALLDQAVDPFGEWESEEERVCLLGTLREAIGRLPGNLRQIMLSHLAGVSIREAAANFGIPVGTVNGWLIQARCLLRAQRALAFERSL